MSQLVVVINTQKNVSTIQLKLNDIYVVENSKWTGDHAKFPYKALFVGTCKVLKVVVKNRVKQLIKKITNEE